MITFLFHFLVITPTGNPGWIIWHCPSVELRISSNKTLLLYVEFCYHVQELFYSARKITLLVLKTSIYLQSFVFFYYLYQTYPFALHVALNHWFLLLFDFYTTTVCCAAVLRDSSFDYFYKSEELNCGVDDQLLFYDIVGERWCVYYSTKIIKAWCL